MSIEHKTEKLLLRLTPSEKQTISNNAKLMNVSMTEYVSLCIRRKRIVICENFPDLIYHLSKIGNNINQIATIANTNQYISVNNVSEVQKLMEKCYKQIDTLISIIAEPEKDFIQNDTTKISEQLEQIISFMQSMDKRMTNLENKNE